MSFFLTLIVSLATAVTRPTSLSCPRGWHVAGVRPTGVFQCRQNYPYPDDCTRARGPCVEREFDALVFRGRVFCPGDRTPVQDSVRIWCARRSAS